MSLEAFERLVAAYSISNNIYSFICAFGSRIKDSDTNFSGYFRTLHHSFHDGYGQDAAFCEQASIDITEGADHCSNLQAEFCFSVRYPDKHGRDLEDPWVMRRILVYQQHNLDSQTSTWILLQCPAILRKRLLNTLSVPGREDCSCVEQIKLHMTVLSAVFKGWRAYINHLETVIEDLVSHSMDNCFMKRQEQRLITT